MRVGVTLSDGPPPAQPKSPTRRFVGETGGALQDAPILVSASAIRDVFSERPVRFPTWAEIQADSGRGCATSGKRRPPDDSHLDSAGFAQILNAASKQDVAAVGRGASAVNVAIRFGIDLDSVLPIDVGYP